MRLTSLIIFMISCFVSYGQMAIESVLNTSGGSATPSTVHLEWNVGEMTSIDLYSAGTTVITAGLLQGNVSTPTNVLYINLPVDAVAFYPNPVAQNLLGTFRFTKSGDLYIRVLNLKGQLIRHWKMQIRDGSMQRNFMLNDLAAGTYFTEVIFVPTTGLMQKGTFTILKL
jgi:hypothetical protein